MEEDDKILDINIDPFTEQCVQPFEEQDKNKAAEGQSCRILGLTMDEVEARRSCAP